MGKAARPGAVQHSVLSQQATLLHPDLSPGRASNARIWKRPQGETWDLPVMFRFQSSGLGFPL